MSDLVDMLSTAAVEPQKQEIIFGAPGCGKTTYLLNLLDKELETVRPERIAYTSFTRKGAREGLHRSMEKFGFAETDFPHFKTIHAICFNELEITRNTILAKKDYKAFSKAMNMKFVGYYTADFNHSDDMYLFMYFLKLNNYDMYETMRDALDVDITTLKHVAHNYLRYKKTVRKMDFTDMLTETIAHNVRLDIDVAFIDEAQDLTTLQWKTCEVLFKRAKRIYIAGDDDQAIYEWTGADVNYFLKQKGERTILAKSWRLSSNLLTFARQITDLIDTRVDKNFDAVATGGAIKYYNTIEGFKFNTDETYYCLSRNNCFLKHFKKELMRQTKLFSYKDKPIVSQDAVWAINHFDAFKKDKLVEKEAVRVKKFLKKDVKYDWGTLWYEAFDMDEDELFYYRQLIQNKTKIEEPKININTIHGVKGGEADNVILLLDVTRAVYKQLSNLSDSELRCLYVACTRARKALHIVFANSKNSYEAAFGGILTGEDVQ